jgi:hypothetical protein
MRLVPALHWLKDVLAVDRGPILGRLRALLATQPHGPAIRADLRERFAMLPKWMQGVVRELLEDADRDRTDVRSPA